MGHIANYEINVHQCHMLPLRLMCLSTCLDLVKRCCLLYKDLTSFPHILQPIRMLLSSHLSAQTLPEPLQVGVRYVWYSNVISLPSSVLYLSHFYSQLHTNYVCCCHRSFNMRFWRQSAVLLWLTVHLFLRGRSLFPWSCSHLRLLKCKWINNLPLQKLG